MNPIELIRENLPELRDIYKVSKIGVFGSFARGEANESSDVDILVEFSQTIGLFHFIKLQQRLSEIVGWKVDLGEPEWIKPLIKDDILGEVIWV